MTQSHLTETADADLGYGQLFAILIRRRFWLLSILFGVLSATVLITLKTKPTYRSTMQLLVEPNYPQKRTLGRTLDDSQTGEDDYATQLALMQSSQFTEEVVARLHTDYPNLKGADLEKNLGLSRVEADGEETQIFAAVYTDGDPVKTQKILDTLQQVYQEYNLEQEKLRLTQGLAFINEQSEAARDRLIQLEDDLEAFRANENFIDPQQQANTVAEALNEIEQERRTVRAQYEDTQTRYAALQGQLDRSPEAGLRASRLSQSSRYQALLDELQTTELTVARERLRLTDNHPDVQVLEEQRQQQLDLLQEEQQRVLGLNSAPSSKAGEPLEQTGQLGRTDQKLVDRLLEVQTELRGLQARDRTLAEIEAELRAELDRFPRAIAEYNRLQPEVEIQRNTIKQLLETRQALSQELARGGFKWQVVEPPQLGVQIAPSPKQNLMLGVVVGVFLGGVAAFVREALDDGVHSTDQLQQQVTLPLLGIVPQLPQTQLGSFTRHRPFRQLQQPEPSLLEALDWQPFRESIDLIYQNIQLLDTAPGSKSLLVTSALVGEGKSTLALGLALSAARLHRKVLLIDGDLRRPTLHARLGLPNDRGLSAVLSGEIASPTMQVFSASGSTLDILTAGPVTADPVKLLSSPRMTELIAQCEQHYDLVLLDTPPILGTVDVLQTALRCRGVVMVARLDRITQSELTQAIAMLGQFNLVGLVANGAKSPPVSYLNPTQINDNIAISNHRSLENPEYERN